MFKQLQSTRALTAINQTAMRLIGAQGDNNSKSIASKLIEQYQALDEGTRLGFFKTLATDYNPSPAAVKSASDAYFDEPSATNLQDLIQAVEPKRQELFRRINRAPQGTKALITMRRAVLAAKREHTELALVDADMHHLLGSWFNPGFLELQKITWQSSAELLEKIIEHESVHAIDGWDDLRRRLQPDRRCYAFFHPQLPNEPLIFVEVALVKEMSDNVNQLIDKHCAIGESKNFKAAVFYSISNCQPGLRGVSLGNFLIKRVAEELLRELPSIKTFATLSPIPGLLSWIDRGAPIDVQHLDKRALKKYHSAKACLKLEQGSIKARFADKNTNTQALDKAEQQALLHLGALYLAYVSLGQHADAVANFHLSNGAQLDRLNWGADSSGKGLAQSAGLMVNYLYELEKVEARHEDFLNGKISVGKAVKGLL